MTDSEMLHSQLLAAGIVLDKSPSGNLLVDDSPLLDELVPRIREAKAALLSLVDRRDTTFFSWIADTCLLTRRASAGVGYLWRAFDLYAVAHGVTSSREEFERLLAAQFQIDRGMATGLCIAQNWDSYQAAYAMTDTPRHTIERKRVKVDFLTRRTAA